MNSIQIPHLRHDIADEYFEMNKGKLLGKGAYGKVYGRTCLRSNDSIETGKYYAVKEIMKRDLFGKIKFIINEIKILQSIDHPYCVKLFDAFQTESHVYLVMEYVPGSNLVDIVLEEGPLSESMTKDIVYQLIEVLSYLHVRKIVHRDIKLDNIMMDCNTMKIKLIDFGIAQFMGNLEELSSFISNFDSTDNLVRTISSNEQDSDEKISVPPTGSLQYMPPELLNHRIQNKRTAREITCNEAQKEDIYSLGVAMYAMLSSCFPFDEEEDKRIDETIILERMKRGSLTFPNTLSVEGIQFCRSLLELDNIFRPCAPQCLRSEWFIKSNSS